LVVLGDVFDRGPNQTEIFWLLYKLEAEAAAIGGRVHLVLGNHEMMVLQNDLRYTLPSYIEAAKIFGKASYAELWSKDTLLGRWLRTKPSVLKLGRTLFLHGGISSSVVAEKLSLADINATARAWLNGEKAENDPRVALVCGPLGPLWYRGYFPGMPSLAQATTEDVEAACNFYGVDRIAVGHTIVPHVESLYASRVIAVDVNMECGNEGRPVAEGVLIDAKGRWHRAKIDGTCEPLNLPAKTALAGADRQLAFAHRHDP
jgi:hypothetical protein